MSDELPLRAPAVDRCAVVDGCITCGDVAVPLTALEAGTTDARCGDDQGRSEVVALELVGPVRPGDRLLVHAGVAIGRVDQGAGPGEARTA